MPIFFIIVGALLIVVAINNKLPDLAKLVKEDFTPEGKDPGFAVWILAIFAIGALGYVQSLKSFANAFLVLLVLVIILRNANPNNTGGGFVAQFTNAIKGI